MLPLIECQALFFILFQYFGHLDIVLVGMGSRASIVLTSCPEEKKV